MDPVVNFAKKFVRKGFNVNTFDDVMDTSGGTMKRTLRGWQLTLLGVGTIVGAGVFVTSGAAAQDAGPAVGMSYLSAGIACVFSALCYAEYACEFPMAGGAFNFITVTFGEFPGWLTAANLFIEWTVANAAVAAGFAGYFVALTGINPTVFTPWTYLAIEPSEDGTFGGLSLQANWLAFLFVAVLTVLMLAGSKESTMVQNISVCIYLCLIAFVIFAGASQTHAENYLPYAPFGAHGVMKGVTIVFFSYVGFDMVASMAEEAVNPSFDMPVGILGSIMISTGIYIAMSTVLVGMQPYADLDPGAPFAVVFSDAGMDWAAKIVAIGALFGCTNSNYGGLLGQSRIFVTMARAGLLPVGMAKMSSRSVPYWSVVASGGIAGLLAFLLDLNALWNLVSIGTLFAYGAVCLGCLWRRYCVPGETPPAHKWMIAGLLTTIVALGMWCGFGNQFEPENDVQWAVPFGLWFLVTGCFYFFPQRYNPTAGFATPFLPWVPAAGMMINLYIIGQLDKLSFIFWGGWLGFCIIIYLVYGLHHTQGEGRAPGSAVHPDPGAAPEKPAYEMAKADFTRPSQTTTVQRFGKASLIDPELHKPSHVQEAAPAAPAAAPASWAGVRP